MQRIMGHLRRAVADYGMIAPNDKICVGISGGKDSIALLVALARSRSFLVQGGYLLCAVLVDMGFADNADHSDIKSLCDSLSVPFYVVKTQIAEIVFSERKEQNPCSLCSKMRRGALVNKAFELGCTKLALGHHLDDAVETFMLSLTQEGRLSCFEPMTELEDKSLTLIRPLVYAQEFEISRAIKKAGITIEKSRCPADGQT
ncbi:MAG: tRNA 2-thiocytidine biosynthesis protein TtcA, partial [Oscillospiraceae bacterium]|nr:tRNA 2-thiocytidine biosynthesis protein TtcA [Oscillospiraceae bacterium]